jgi:hypothetical protein
MSPSEVEEVIEELVRAGEVESDIRRFYSSREAPTTYRDSGIRSFFPEIMADDVRVYACSHTGGQTFAYASKRIVNSRVNVRRLDCNERRDGLYCVLEKSVGSADKSPQEFVYVFDSLDEKKALRIVHEYRRRIAPTLDPRFSLDVDSIGGTAGTYSITLGRRGCACRGDVEVRERRFLGLSFGLYVSREPSVKCT